ncbi:OmpA family protein [Treponema phagedenis]|nr:OmpA family protein [Treponema phagedenis]
MVSFFLFSTFAEEDAIGATVVQDWENTTIDSKISLDINKEALHLPADRNTALARIHQESPRLMKDVYLSVLVDSSNRMGDYLAEKQITMNDINKLIEEGTETPAAFSQDLKDLTLYHQAKLGKAGELFVKHSVPYKPAVPPSSTVSKVYSGILIDARGNLPVHGEYETETLQPCLFPKVWDTDMNLIYEKNMVLPAIAKKQGIIRYASALNEKDYRDIIGVNPLRIVARGVFGQNRTDPIIAGSDAAQILAKPENLKLLEEGKLIIICNKENLRTSLPYPLPDENFYFAYHNIKKMFSKETPDSINMRPGINTIKITMYDIRFIADSPEILPEEKGRVDIIARALRAMGPYTKFLIEGHTADINQPKNQLVLSVARADKIAEELAKRGIDASRMTTAGYGGTRPIAPNDTSPNRAKNRRVEITIMRD